MVFFDTYIYDNALSITQSSGCSSLDCLPASELILIASNPVLRTETEREVIVRNTQKLIASLLLTSELEERALATARERREDLDKEKRKECFRKSSLKLLLQAETGDLDSIQVDFPLPTSCEDRSVKRIVRPAHF